MTTLIPILEHKLFLSASPEEVFAFLSDTANVPLFAPGIEEATLIGGENRLQGALLGLRTRRGEELRAQITHYHENEFWTVVDERNTLAQIMVEPVPGGTLLTATLRGEWERGQRRRVEAEWLRKLEELPQRIGATPIAAR